MFFLAGLIRSTVLYAFVYSAVGAAWYGMGASTALGLAGIYLAVLALHHVVSRVWGWSKGWRPGFMELVGGSFMADVTMPFRGLGAIRRGRRVIDTKGVARAYQWGEGILHFVWSAAFWVALIFAVARLLV